MIPINEAQRRLIQNGFTVDLQSPYRELTILDASYPSVKQYLLEQGYEGNIIVVGKRRRNGTTISESISHSSDSDDKNIDRNIKSSPENFYHSTNAYVEDSDGQLSFV